MAGLLVCAQASTLAAPPAGYTLSWSEEFHQGVGAGPDPKTWDFQLGDHNANDELENYVNDLEHAHIIADPKADDGQALQILSTNTHGYESARISTSGKHPIQYGFVETRIKLPYGQGIWPAFWMLGQNIGKVGWPACGEIDIMENIGMRSWWSKNMASLHSSGADNPRDNYTKNAPYTLPAQSKTAPTLHDDYHLYQMLWMEDSLSFYIDGNLYQTRARAEYGKNSWPFNAPFFFLINTAVGGNWPGSPDSTTPFPQAMLVDYVRVYDGKAAVPATPVKVTAAPGESRQILLTWPGDVNATSYTIYRSTRRGDRSETPFKTGIAATSYRDIALEPGTKYYYRVAAVNAAGASTPSQEVSMKAPRGMEAPYDRAFVIGAAAPVRIELEDFDRGGEGIAYHDTDPTNNGSGYRPDDGVDIEDCSDTDGGYDVGWTTAGEWMRYTVDVRNPGKYTVTLRVSAAGNGGTLHFEDGKGHNLSDPIAVPGTGGWNKWTTVMATVDLPAGKQVLQLTEDTGGYNLNAMTVRK
jgi:beta-glucanase (GH16 family)